MTNIYFWGKPISPSFQQTNLKKSNNLKTIHSDTQIQQIQCGAQHSFILTQNNQLYAFGSNEYGQMGLMLSPHKYLQISRVLVPTRKKIVSISCGWYHTLVIDQIGDLYSTGKGTEGAIGNRTCQNNYGFALILNNVKKASAGYDHSLAIKGNKVFGWGNTEQGQLGLHSKKRILSPKQLNVYPCQDLFAGAKFSIFNTVKGVYVCGKNDNFQLGLGHENEIHYPKKLQFEEHIQKIWGSNYCFAKNRSNQVYIWGSGAFGVYKFPTKISFFEGCDNISVGLNFGIASKNNKIFVWGSNKFGQLGNQSSESKQYASQSINLSLLNLTNFSCGSNFVVGISDKQPNTINQGLKSEFFKDSIKQNSDIYSQRQKQHDFDLSKNSFYSSQPGFKIKQNNLFVDKNDKAKKNQLFKGIPFQMKSKINLKEQKNLSSSGSMNSKSHSKVTVKQTTSPTFERFIRKNEMNIDIDIQKIDGIIEQLKQLRSEVNQKSKRNECLNNEKEYFREFIRQNKTKYNVQKQKSDQFFYPKKDKIQKQNNQQLEKFKREYQEVSAVAENNDFLRNLLNKDSQSSNSEQDFSYQDSFNQNLQLKCEQIQDFGLKLIKLKNLLFQSVHCTQQNSKTNQNHLLQA